MCSRLATHIESAREQLVELRWGIAAMAALADTPLAGLIDQHMPYVTWGGRCLGIWFYSGVTGPVARAEIDELAGLFPPGAWAKGPVGIRDDRGYRMAVRRATFHGGRLEISVEEAGLWHGCRIEDAPTMPGGQRVVCVATGQSHV